MTCPEIATTPHREIRRSLGFPRLDKSGDFSGTSRTRLGGFVKVFHATSPESGCFGREVSGVGTFWEEHLGSLGSQVFVDFLLGTSGPIYFSLFCSAVKDILGGQQMSSENLQMTKERDKA